MRNAAGMAVAALAALLATCADPGQQAEERPASPIGPVDASLPEAPAWPARDAGAVVAPAPDAGADPARDGAVETPPVPGDAGLATDADAAIDAGIVTGPDAAIAAAADAALDAAIAADPDAAVAADSDAGPDAAPEPPDASANPDADAGAPAARYHPTAWMAAGTPTFHGDAAKQAIGSCQGCHGADLGGGAVKVSCNDCHAGWRQDCTFCHGGEDNALGAPPQDTRGRTATTEPTVGAHSAHVMARSGLAAPLDCSACHATPEDALSPGHMDAAPAEVRIAGWDRANGTCSGTSCHGAFAGGTATNAPRWTSVGSGQAACGTCHALSPRTGRHPSVFARHGFMGQDCTQCHQGITDTQGTAIARPALHINGAKDVLIANGSWDAATSTCTTACHSGPKRW